MKILTMSAMAVVLFAAPAIAQNTEPAVSALAADTPAAAPSAPPATPVLADPKADTASPAPVAATSGLGPIAPPPAGLGQIVFFRSGSLFGGAVSCAVSESGVKLSSLYIGHYFIAGAGPGIHSFTVSSEATDTLRLEIEPGETYYVQCSIGMGFMAGRPNLSPSTKEKFTGMKLKQMGAAQPKS